MAFRGSDDRAYSARYGARDPLLAAWPRLTAYLIWRAVMAALRPVVFLALLAGAVGFAASALRQAPVALQPAASPSDRIEQAFLAASPQRSDRRAIWLDGVDAALQPRRRAVPDLPLARSYAASAMLIEGREALAIRRLGDGRRASAVEADLRGRPALERAALLERALNELEAEGGGAGLEPPTLILAPAPLRERLERADRLYGPALDDAGRWFADPGGRALALASLPGAPPGAPVLYGDVRDVLVYGCALAGASGRSIGQCRVGFLPKPDADPILAGLALAVMGASHGERAGARLVKAAYAAGHMDPALAERVAFGPDAELGREAVLAAVMPVLGQAGEAWTQPFRFQDALSRAAAQAAQARQADSWPRADLFQAVSATARAGTPLAAIRLVGTLSRPEDGEQLALLAEESGPQLLALQDLAPGGLRRAVAGAASERGVGMHSWPRRALIHAGAASALALGAAGLLIVSLLAGYFRARGRAAGGLERLDGAVTRLILGKNF